MFKKEIRILGLSSRSVGRSKAIFVGVVFRGSLWLDGVFTCVVERAPRKFLSKLARAIVESKQYTQLHAVILLKRDGVPSNRIDTLALSHMTHLPIISVLRRGARFDRKRLDRLTLQKGQVLVEWAGIETDSLREVYSIGCAHPHRIPEALRVAELISKGISQH